MAHLEEMNKLESIYGQAQLQLEKVNHLLQDRFPNLLHLLLLKKWTLKTLNRDLQHIHPLDIGVFRTNAGQLVVSITSLLLELDEVQSNGNEEIRNKRRNIVKFINETVLPVADTLLDNAKRLVALEARIIKKPNLVSDSEDSSDDLKDEADFSAEEDDENMSDLDSQASSSDLDEESNNGTEDEQIDMKKHDTNDSTQRVMNDYEQPVISEPQHNEIPHLEYKTQSTGDKLVITIQLPKNVPANVAEVTMSVEGHHYDVTIQDPFHRFKDLSLIIDGNAVQVERLTRINHPQNPNILVLVAPKYQRPLYCQQPLRSSYQNLGARHPHDSFFTRGFRATPIWGW